MILPLLNLDFQKRLLFLLENLNCKWCSGDLPTEKLYRQATYVSLSKKKNLWYGDRKYSNLLDPKSLIGSKEMKYFPEDSKRLNRFI